MEEARLTPSKRPAPAEAQQPDGSGDGEVQRFLAGIGLARYHPKLAARGFDSMEALEAMGEEDMRGEAGMLPGHVRLLQRHLAKRRGAQAKAPPAAAPAAAPAPPMPEAAAAGPRAPAPAGAEAELPPPAAQQLPLAPKAAARPPPESAVKPVGELLERARAGFRERRAAAPGEAGAEAAEGEAEAERREREARQEAEAQYLAALRAAQAAAVADPEPAGPDDTLMAMAQLAEESTQLVATAASFCAWPQADARQLAAVVGAAQHAAQRSQWAAVASVAYGGSEDHDKEWSQKMRRAAVQAAEVAERYARDCAKAAASTGRPQAAARAFCRFHAEGRCLKGIQCEFCHDNGILPTLPLVSKIELPCCYFAKGHCNRGAGCPFPHGDEELNEVVRLKRGQPLTTQLAQQ